LQHQRRHGSHRGVVLERSDQTLDEVGTAIHVVVEQHHDLARPGGDAAVACLGEASVVLEALEIDLRPFAAKTLAGVVGRAVVDDDHAVPDGLRAQVAKAAEGELVAPVGDDHHVDRRRHRAPWYSAPPAPSKGTTFGVAVLSIPLLQA
jgi:hypothetical protein